MMSEPKDDTPEKPLIHGVYRNVGDFVEVAEGLWLAWAILDEPPSSCTRALHIHRDGTPAYARRFGYTGDFIGSRARARKGGLHSGQGPEPEDLMEYFYILPDGSRIK